MSSMVIATLNVRMKAGMKECCNGFSMLEVLLHDRLHIPNLHTTVPAIIGQNAHSGSHITLSLAAATNYHSTRYRSALESCQHSRRAVSQAIGVLANENLTARVHSASDKLSVKSFELRGVENSKLLTQNYFPKPLPRLADATVRQFSTCDRSAS
jgi:hypothetical protein